MHLFLAAQAAAAAKSSAVHGPELKEVPPVQTFIPSAKSQAQLLSSPWLVEQVCVPVVIPVVILQGVGVVMAAAQTPVSVLLSNLQKDPIAHSSID